MVRDKFSSSHADGLKKMNAQLENETGIIAAVKGHRQGSPGAAESTQPRTSASPEWIDGAPWNFKKTMETNGIPCEDFDTANSLLDSQYVYHASVYVTCLCFCAYTSF